jgi:hypothetical protein
MKNSTYLYKLLLLLLGVFSSTSIFGQSTASYDISFISSWEHEIIDPTSGNSTSDIPENAHWSNLVGTTHNSNFTLLKMGTLASLGIKNVAESGNNTALFNEVNSSENTNQWLQQGFSPFAAISSATLSDVVVTSDFPLLSLVSMIAPSPDWIIAIDAINLRDNNAWIDDIVLDLFPYDAGTDSGLNYSSLNQVSVPPQIIRSLINEGPFNTKPIGTLTISLNQTLSIDALESSKITLYPNPTKGNITIKTSNTGVLDKVLVHDILGREVANFKNSNSKHTLQINLEHLKNGIYVLRLLLNDGTESTKKVVIN